MKWLPLLWSISIYKTVTVIAVNFDYILDVAIAVYYNYLPITTIVTYFNYLMITFIVVYYKSHVKYYCIRSQL
jgi:hypothetical protein